MEEQSNTGVTPAKWDQWEGKPGGGHVLMAVLLLIAAGVLAAMGFYVALTYDDGSRLVGGDAFNLQIIASRGLVWLGGGMVLALAGVTHAVLAVRAAVLATVIARTTPDGVVHWMGTTRAGMRRADDEQSI